MPLVETSRVATDEPVHAHGEGTVRQIENCVPMRREQTNRDTPPAEPVDRRDEKSKPNLSIQVISKVDSGSGGTDADVLNTWPEIARDSWHGV